MSDLERRAEDCMRVLRNPIRVLNREAAADLIEQLLSENRQARESLRRLWNCAQHALDNGAKQANGGFWAYQDDIDALGEAMHDARPI